MKRLMIASCTLLFTMSGYVFAQSASLNLQQSPTSITGSETNLGINFDSSLTNPNKAIVNLYSNGKKIHAEIDYALQTVAIRTTSLDNGSAASLTPLDIQAFQQLKAIVPRRVDAASHHGDALASLINLAASAPPGFTFMINSSAISYTSICNSIGSSRVAHFDLRSQSFNRQVTVGPACFTAPALGRCGAGGGPDPVIGSIQRFTQQCLNHDLCCVAAGDFKLVGVNVCGNAKNGYCAAEFAAAAPGFFLAPDCSAARGQWSDNFGISYDFTGGNSGGVNTSFTGTANTGACGAWSVNGSRDGQNIQFTAVNPAGASTSCSGSYEYSGTLTDCSTGNGSWSNDGGYNGDWSWNRDAFDPQRAQVAFLKPSRAPTQP